MKNGYLFLRVTAIAAALAGTLVGCGSSTPAAGTLTLYNGQHQQTTDALVTEFEKQTGVAVKVRSASEGTLVQQILAEGSASPADVVYTENTPALERLRAAGRLAPVTPSTLAATPSQYNSPQGRWVGVSARVTVMVYNTRSVTPAQLPTSALDLANPRWKGTFGFAPTETDLQPVVISIAKARGEQAAVAWLKALEANAGPRIYPDNETVTASVNSGAAGLSLENHYYWFRLAQDRGAAKLRSAVALFAPGDPGYVRDVSGAAVLSSSRNQANAQLFLAFLNSRRGESILAAGDSYEYPLGSSTAASPKLAPSSSLSPAAVTPVDLGDGSLALRLERRAGLV